MTGENIRVALFPCTYREIDGVANTSKQFAEFARKRGIPFLMVYAGPTDEIVVDGSLTRIQLRRGRFTFPLDGHHEFDLLFSRHYQRLLQVVRDFAPNIIQITGPSDVGILGALVAHNLHVTLAASWQTNIHQFAGRRVSSLLSSWPKKLSRPIAAGAEAGSFRAAAHFYKIPRLLFTPNLELVELLGKATGKPCFLMGHSVDTETFSPNFRERSDGPFQIGYVGRLTPEKNVRFLAQLEKDLLAKGIGDFRIVLIGQGAEENWLRQNMKHVEFKGWLTGRDLSLAYANMDAFVFPSETDTFGLAVLEALASGVPAVVTSSGGPAATVEHGKSGYVAKNYDEFAPLLMNLMTQPELQASMRMEARARALTNGSWEQIFSGMYSTYERYAQPAAQVEDMLLDDARKIMNT
ncbi:MAG TPA: glycosyltransferase [Candidatus Acidoferrales bacterium]|nr:glycosyltransferase [Candidatus Acidoferrales bacterium]